MLLHIKSNMIMNNYRSRLNLSRYLEQGNDVFNSDEKLDELHGFMSRVF